MSCTYAFELGADELKKAHSCSRNPLMLTGQAAVVGRPPIHHGLVARHYADAAGQDS